MNLNSIRANMTELELSAGHKILFSYRTPVAEIFPQGHAYTTETKWSVTTTRHINQWLSLQDGFHKRDSRPQEYFDNLLKEVA